MKRLIIFRIALSIFFVGLLATPAIIRRVSSQEVSHSSLDTRAALARHGFYLQEVSRQAGIDFVHQAPTFDSKLQGIMPEVTSMGAAVSIVDFDRDGWPDIYVTNSGEGSKNHLYRNQHDGTFKDVAEEMGIADVNQPGTGVSMGAVWGDYDNDGYEDLYVTAYGGNRLYHNNGNGTFTDVTAPSGTAGQGWSTSAAWVDLDNDGLLDLVVLRYLQWDFTDIWCGEHREGYRAYCHPDVYRAIPPLVYHNDGNGHFTEVSAKIGLNLPGKGLGLAIADFDRDGHIDIAVANDSMSEFLYRNKGDGTFEEVGSLAEIAVDGNGRTYAGMGIDFADYNGDGLPDLVITNLAEQKYALYRNNGDGSFTYDTYQRGLAGITLLHSGWSIHFLDYDNDGLTDLLVPQGHDLDTIQLNFPELRYREPMLLARNTGKTFVDVSAQSGPVFQQPWVARGMAVGDIDNDGRIDAVVTLNGGPAHVLHNQTATSNHWLLLKLVGHRSNRDAIGAEITLTTPQRKQVTTVSTTSGYLSANDKRAHFGLGSATSATAIDIRWPSGIRQHLDNVKADQILTIDEPAQSTPTTAPATAPGKLP